MGSDPNVFPSNVGSCLAPSVYHKSANKSALYTPFSITSFLLSMPAVLSRHRVSVQSQRLMSDTNNLYSLLIKSATTYIPPKYMHFIIAEINVLFI